MVSPEPASLPCIADVKASGRPTLGYWKLRGLGHPIRYCLEFLGCDYDERLMQNWMQYAQVDKPALLKDDPLANLPFFVDGDFVVSETLAIIRYVCAKWGPHLLGSTPQQAAQHDSALCSIYYANNNLRSYCYGYLPQSRVKVDEQLVALRVDAGAYESGVAEWIRVGLRTYQTLLGDKAFLFGAGPLAADFFLYEHVQCCLAVDPGALEALPALAALCRRVEQLPAIQRYMASERWIDRPFHAPFVKVGNPM